MDMVKQIGDIKLYSVKDLNRDLGINERTIRRWLREGVIKGRKIGKEWYITEDNLRRYLSGGMTATVNDIHEILGVNSKKLRRWLREGKLEGHKIEGKWYISVESLKRFLGAK
jgi:excisionase family DNA binding protein